MQLVEETLFAELSLFLVVVGLKEKLQIQMTGMSFCAHSQVVDAEGGSFRRKTDEGGFYGWVCKLTYCGCSLVATESCLLGLT